MTKPTLPRTGPGRDTQVIFDRPELQARRHRLVYSTLTLIAWVIWMYLWLPVVTLVAWYLGVRVFVREIVIPDPQTILAVVLAYLLVVLVFAVVLVGWSQYNLRRFGGKDRRRFPAPLADAELADWFGIPPERLAQMRGLGRMRIEHDEEGAPIAVRGPGNSAVAEGKAQKKNTDSPAPLRVSSPATG